MALGDLAHRWPWHKRAWPRDNQFLFIFGTSCSVWTPQWTLAGLSAMAAVQQDAEAECYITVRPCMA